MLSPQKPEAPPMRTVRGGVDVMFARLAVLFGSGVRGRWRLAGPRLERPCFALLAQASRRIARGRDRGATRCALRAPLKHSPLSQFTVALRAIARKAVPPSRNSTAPQNVGP